MKLRRLEAIGLRVESELRSALERIAERRREALSIIAREALREYVAAHEQNGTGARPKHRAA